MHSSLIATVIDWKDILVNRSFIRNNHTISWENYSYQTLPEIIRKSDFNNLEASGQYSIQMIDDGSIFQLFYEYCDDNETLLHANLAFIGSGSTEEIFKEESDLLLHENHDDADSNDWEEEFFSSSAVGDSDPIVPWLRIDYKPEDEQGPLHHRCHMHIGLFRHARISMSRVPTPRQFVEFVIAICYPHHYREKRLIQNANFEPLNLPQLRKFNSSCFPQPNCNVFDILPYIEIPLRE